MQELEDTSVPPDGAALAQPGIAREFRAPATRSGTVSRSALIERARSSGARLVSVVAPAGYGKSTLMSEWAAEEARRTIWVRLDSLDDDPARLLAVLTTAFARVSSTASSIESLLTQSAVEPLGRGAPLLAAAFRQTPDPFALFIDDVHAVASPACEDVLDVVLAAVPDESVAILASRHGMPFVARQRVERRMHEIGAGDLRLDTVGARRIAEEAGAHPSDSELQEWVRRVDGWPAGLFLCALIFQEGRQSLQGSDREIADYLYRECIAGLPEELRSFLLRTSVLAHLSAESCDAILETTDAARWLSALVERNLFLLPIDGRRGWYRYHDLFREYLQYALIATDSVAAARLHTRAADWHEANGLCAHAIEHSFEAGDKVRAAALIAANGLAVYQRGEVILLDGWLKRLGDRTLIRAPWTTVLAVWIALLQGVVPDAVRWLRLLDQLDTDSLGPDAVAIESQRAMVRAGMRRYPIDAGLADAVFAVEAEPRTSPWYDQALHLHGLMLALSGDAVAARPVLHEASRIARHAGNADTILLAECDLARLAIAERDWPTARRHSHAALAVVAEHHMDGYGTSTLPYALGARIAVHSGDSLAAERLLPRGMRAREYTSHLLPTLAVQSRIHLAYAWIGRDDLQAARALLDEIDEVIAHGPHLGTLADDIEELRDRLRGARQSGARLHGARLHGARLTGDAGNVPLTVAELRLIPYLQTHLTLAQIGERLFVSRNTVSTQTASVYRKLGVQSRGAAVDEATRRGLLGS